MIGAGQDMFKTERQVAPRHAPRRNCKWRTAQHIVRLGTSKQGAAVLSGSVIELGVVQRAARLAQKHTHLDNRIAQRCRAAKDHPVLQQGVSGGDSDDTAQRTLLRCVTETDTGSQLVQQPIGIDRTAHPLQLDLLHAEQQLGRIARDFPA